MLKHGEWMTFSLFIFFFFFFQFPSFLFPDSSIILERYCDTQMARDKTKKLYGSCH